MSTSGEKGVAKEKPFPIEDRLYALIKDVEGRVEVYSPAFKNGSRIPAKYTCDGDDVSIPLEIRSVPDNTESIVVIMYDPDAPHGYFYHWIIYNIPPGKTVLPEGINKTKDTPYGSQGVNDFGGIGYGGPCPPLGHGVHRYYILVLALDIKLDLSGGASLEELVNSIEGHVIAYGYIYGTYSR